MKRAFILVAILSTLAASGSGCGSGTNNAGTPSNVVAVHSGTILPMPDGRGFVEILIRSQSDNTKPTGKGASGRVIAYFLNKDGSGPSDPAPTDVTYSPADGKPYKMTPIAESAPKSAGFQTEVGPFSPGRELSGELSASLGGEAVKLPIVTR